MRGWCAVYFLVLVPAFAMMVAIRQGQHRKREESEEKG